MNEPETAGTSCAAQVPYDPIRFCVFATVALLAWLLGPGPVLVLMSGLGLWAYVAAWRRGLRETKCFLRDPRLAMGYLGATFVAGVVLTVRTLAQYV
jgi:hypothetical protein